MNQSNDSNDKIQTYWDKHSIGYNTHVRGTLNRECARPGCNATATRTYDGARENALRVCRECYYKLVTGR